METFELDKFQKLIDNNKDKLGLSWAKLGTAGVKISLALIGWSSLRKNILVF